MNLESQVCSLASAKRLKKLGAKQESLFFWCEPWPNATDQTIHVNTYHYATEANARFRYSAYTVAELGEMLPIYVYSKRFFDEEPTYEKEKRWGCLRPEQGMFTPECLKDWCSDTEAEARAKMLIYLLEKEIK